MTPPAIVITSGEPAGIGPELCAMLAARHAAQPYPARLLVIGDRELLHARARRIGIEPRYIEFRPADPAPAMPAVEIWHEPLVTPVVPGSLDPANATSVIAMLARACDACATGAFDALVTAPVQKSVLLDAGHAFSGHTEFFAKRTHTPRVVMMLAGAGDRALRVALATTHIPLHEVAQAITQRVLGETLDILAHDLRRKFGIEHPRIAVCGLNPHAGEGGHLGREDLDVIAPSIADARARGIDAHGPVPADTVFVPMHARNYDAILAMYHDQGLPPLKASTFGEGVNVTLGLPFIRTSVDHGTALDLAADAERARSADAGSLLTALDLAIDLARRATTPPGRSAALA